MSSQSRHQRGMRTFAAHRRALRRVVMAVVLVLVVVVGLPLGSATAYQAATSVTQAGQTITGNTPSGWTWAATSAGATTVLDATSSPGTYAATSAMFTPNLATTSPMDRISTNLGTCPATGLCSNLGTVTINFSQPVKNPAIHVMGIGAQASGGGGGTIFHVTPTLTASTPAGATLGSPSAGAANMTVTGGTTIDATNYLASTSCGSMTTGATALAVCGSVPVVGTVTSLTFTISAQGKAYSGSGATNSGAADAWGLLVTAPEDFGDAPASYDAAGAAANVVGDLKLGSAIDEDNANVVNGTTSPNAVAAGANANGTNGDGADEDALTTWPAVPVSSIGSSYSVTVPIAGASKAGQVCGWVDFDKNGTYDAGEKACTAFAAAATSVTLTWTVPATSAGLTYARLRAAYGAATMSPTGALDSGETEDYSLAVMPVVKVTKVLAAGSTGTFDLKVNGTTLATGVGNGGTTGNKTVFNTSTYGAPSLTVAQDPATTAVPLTVAEANAAGNTNSYATTYACVNGAGTTVASGSTTSASVSIPASSGTNGTAQNISCTFTNTQAPSIGLVKSVSSVTDVNGNGVRDAGDKINYSFVVTNTGGAALTNVAVTDPKVTGISCPGTTLALGANMTCTASYTLTQADVDSGSVPNTATATGKAGATNVSATSSVTTTITASPSLSLQKTVASVTDVNADGKNDAGDRISWTFKVTNTGNVTVNTIAVSDPKAGTITCSPTTLAPGASVTCTAAAYTITQTEGDAGVVTNTATATGKSPSAATVTSNTSSTSTTLVRSPALTITKSAAVTDVNTNGKTDLGDRIQWSFLVKNTGNVTLTTMSVTDAKAGPVSCPTTTLAPGAQTTCTATTAYTITQADVDAGSVTNTATAGATQPSGATVTSSPSSTNTPVVQTSALQLTKTAAVTDVNTDGLTDLGDKVTWSFLVKNTGTVTINTVAVSDPTAGTVTCSPTTLAPGAQVTCTATAHTITQADVDAGVVSNTATATGKNPSNATVTSNTSSTATPVVQTTTLALLKSAAVTDVNGNGKTDLGDKIQWSFKATNTGTVTLNTLSISDAKAGAISCPVTTLAPGASTTCTATTAYTVTQADVDAGVVNNTATASAKNPSGTTVSSTPSSTSTPVNQVSALTLTKSAAVTDVNGNGKTDLGDKITWSFLVKNTGTVTLTTVAVSDPTAGPVTCSPTTLAPGAQVTCTAAAHTITQADVDAGVVNNTASATGKNPANATVTSNPSSTSTPVNQVSALTLTKSATVTDVNGNGKTDLGDKIQWSFLVKNTGTLTITTTAVTDAKAGAISCPVTTLAPNAQTTCTATAQYSITQADVDNGVVSNTAVSTGKNPANATVTSNTSQTDTPVNQAPALQLTKSAAVTDVNGNGVTDLGDKIQWSFLVKNTGTVTLNTLAINDAKAGATTCPATTLAPGAQTTCTATVAYVISQADVDAGVVNNTATATTKNPSGATVTSNSSSTTTPVVQSSALQLTKSAVVTDVNGNGVNDLGDKITWSFLVKNTGTTTVTSVAVSDGVAGSVSCPTTTLAPGASTTCTAAVHTITQTDVDNGVVSNVAVAAGKNPANATVTSNTSRTDTTVTRTSALALVKHAAVNDVNNSFKTDLGDTITWTFTATNNGTTTLTGLAVTDPIAGAVTCLTTTLAPGASTTCTATTAHPITQADVDAGSVSNTATAAATDSGGATVTSSPSSTTTPVNQVSTMTLTKSAAVTDVNANGKTDLGDKIQWSFLVKNTGTVTLTSASVTDAKAGAISCPATTLAPGAQTTCTATTAYTITQTDVDAGVVNNTATASAQPPSGAAITSSPSSTSTPVVQTSALQLTKSAAVTDVNGNGKTDLGDKIQWSFLVKNTGTATITGLAVSDATAGAVSCPVTTLAPNAQTTCTATATHTISQADVDAGVVSNTATATGKNPANATVTSNSSHTDTAVVQAPGLQLTKSAAVTDVNGNGKTDLGDTITWSFLVKNTGTVTVHGIAVSDPKAGAVTCSPTTLAPGAQVTCTSSPYTIVQSDVDTGHVDNTATASGLNPSNGAVTSNQSSTSTPVSQANSLLLTKSAVVNDMDGDFVIDLGDQVQWSFLVKNNGTGTITGISVSDLTAGAVSCPVTTLTPGAQTTCTATAPHPISQADVDAGVVNNTATASGTSPLSTTITSNPSSTSTPIAQSPALTVTKSASVTDANSNGKTDLGDSVNWTFLVKNTGTVTLTGVAVSDPKAGAVSCPATALAPGAQTTCSAAGHTVTQADVDAGIVSNTATASGKTPANATVTSPPSSTDTPVAQSSALTLTKSAAVTDVNGNGRTDLGDRITWSFLVKNTGTVTLTGVAVNDPKAGAVSCPATTLVPGAQTTCTAAAYTITQTDVDAGVVTNTATASGKDPANSTVPSSPSSTTTPVSQVATLQLTKSAAVTDVNGNGKTDLGDKVTWSFLVKNTGTATITSVAVNDPTAGAVSCPATTLVPGASTTCTAASHTITQADVDAGVVANTATATGKDPGNHTVTSSPSSTSTPVAQTSAMTLTKSASVSDVNGNFKIDLGDRITWTLLVKNTGTTTINSVAVSDPAAGPVSCPATTLAPGASTTCTVAVHVITQADVDAGIVSNTATASAKDPQGGPVTAGPSTADTPVDQNSGIQLTKNALVTDVDGDGKTDLGDRITWSFLVRNTGSVTLTSVAVTDPKAGAISCPATTLAPGATTTCTAAAYTITQTDVDAGVVNNTATANGRNPSGATVTSTSSSTTTPVAQTATLQLTKSAAVTDVNGNGKTDLGDRITWSFLVKNTGSTTVTALSVNDPKAGAVTCSPTTLAPGAQVTCTSAAHTITQAEVDAGVVSNTATATAKNPSNATVTSNPSSTDTPVSQAPGLTVTKSAAVTDVNGNGVTDLGDRIAWSFLVRNTGTTTVAGVAVNDPKAGAVSCPATTLAPGATTTCTATGSYTITQADVDAGHVANTATASATDPLGNPLTAPPSSTDTPVSQSPGLSLVKTASTLDVNGDFKIDLGDTVSWSFLVRNTGTVTVTGLTVADPTAGTISCPTTTLAPGAQTTCTSGPHTITQADVDAGVVSNTATASATPSGGGTVTSPPSSTDTPVAQTDDLSLAKSAAVTDVNGNTLTDLGDTIRWSFVVRNTGTTTVTGVAVNDPTAGAVSCPTTTLAPGAQTTCTSGSYTITQADVDAGHVANTATASAQTLSGHSVTSPPSSTDTPVSQTPGLDLAKTAAINDVNGDGQTDLGDTITWSFAVTNTGTTTVSSLVVTDPTAGAITCPVTTLPVGGSTVCTSGPHTVTQADVDAGVVSNTATAGGRNPQGGPVISAPSSADTPVHQAPALSLVKSATVTDVNADGRPDLTDRINWSFVVTNTGTTTLTGVMVTDPTAGPVSCPVTTLAPGASTTCTAPAYTVTQPDVDAGHVDNTATASATAPDGSTVPSNPSSVSTPIAQRPNPALTKTATVVDNNADGLTDLGDTVNWSFLVENTGTVTLDSIQVTDPTAGPVTCPSTMLSVGASMTCTAAPYAITQADVDAGFVANTAWSSGHSPSLGTTISNDSSTDTPIDQRASMAVTKHAAVVDVDGDGHTGLGDHIVWTFTVQNTGTVTMDGVTVNDAKAGSVTCPVTTLAPGATTTCAADAPYVVTQADVDAGHVANTATVTGQDPGGTPHTSPPSTTDTNVDRTAALTMTKSAAVTDVDADGATDLGDKITWSFLLTNTGTATLGALAVSDPTAGAVSCPVSSLAPGASTTCTATTAHVVTQADVDAGVVSNTATASGTDPAATPVSSAPSSTDTPVQQTPGLHLTKSAVAADVDGDGHTDLGDTVTWTFLVTNTGTVTVHTVAVTDPSAGAVSCPAGSLAPGASVTCTTTDHVVSQADVDAGHVDNTATASALTPSGGPATSNPSSTSTPIHQTPGVTVAKSASVTDADADGLTDLGDVVTWSFLVTNTGTTTITTLSVNDPIAGAVTCPTTTLAPGGTTTCTAVGHSVTQADVDAGVVSNTATAQAKDPSGTTVTSPPSSTDTPVDQSPGVSVTKSAAVTDVNGDGKTGLGDRIVWSFLVSNTGTTSISSIVVNDPKAGPVTCPVTTLARGAATTCTAGSYTITQADVDAGVVSNVATVGAKDPQGDPIISPPSSTDTPVNQTAGLTVVKAAAVTDVNSDGVTDLGDTIQWSFTVTNTGTTTVHAVAVNDPTAGAVTCPSGTVAPGASVTCTADVAHPIAQPDVDAGDVSNTATASARDPGNVAVVSGPSSTDTPVHQAPALHLTKSATPVDVDSDGLTDLGDWVDWSFLVTNTGTTTVHGLVVTDPKAGAVSCPLATLAPGASTTCTTAPFTISQADVDAGVVSNVARASALDPAAVAVVSPDSTTDTPVAQAPALSLLKSAVAGDVDGDGRTDLGDTVSWSFAVTNTGTTTVTGLAITDAKAGAVTCPVTTLAPGDSTTCTATTPHAVSQADVDAGIVSNTATAHGTTAGTTVVSAPSSTDTPVAQTATLAATKHAAVTDVNGNGQTDKGDRITWSVTVVNTGTVTVHGLTISDPTAGALSCAATLLAPGASTVCTAATPYTITQPDVDAGHVDNTATADGFDPGGAPVHSPPASVSTPVVSVPAITLTKQAATFDANGDGVLGVGDTISWTFVVTNAGSLTLTNVAVDDAVAGAVTCPVTTLAPDDTTTCTADAPHPITQADVDLGDVTNTATASASYPASGTITSLPSSTDTPLDQLAQLRLVKHGAVADVNHDGITDAGDSIQWTFDVTNTGRVTLTTVNVTDTKAGPVSCAKTTLTIGESTMCTALAPYSVTNADASAGAVHNVATAIGSCGCRAAVKAVKAAAVVATKKHTSGGHGAHPSDPPASRDPVLPALPFTGAIGVTWAIRGGLMALVVGAFLLVVGRRRRDEDEDEASQAITPTAH